MQVDIYSRPWTYDRDEITSRHLKSVNGHLTIIFLADDNGYILAVALLLIGYYRQMVGVSTERCALRFAHHRGCRHHHHSFFGTGYIGHGLARLGTGYHMKRDDFYDTSNANSHNSTPSPRGKLMDHLSGFRFVGSHGCVLW